MDSVKVESQPINVNENVKRLDVSEPPTTQKPQLQETVKGSLVIQVHAANSAPIKQEIPLSQLQQMQTIVVESQRVDVNGIPKVNVFVHKSGEAKPKEEEKAPAVMKTARLQQTPASNLPWQLPGSVQPSRVIKYGAPEAETTTEKPTQETEKPVDPQIWRPVEPQANLVDVQQRIQQAVQPITPLSIGPQSIQPTAPQTIQQNSPPTNQQASPQFPTRWSVIRQGPWTHQDEKTFLQRWYKHFGIALSDAGGFARKQVEQKEPVNEEKDQSTKSESLITESTIQADSTTQAPFSQSNEAHIQALREAHEKRESKKEEMSKHEKESKTTDDSVPVTKLRDDAVTEAVRSETIRPPTVVINKESKEKLIVRHSIKGSTLHLEKLTSAELREDDTATTQAPSKQTENQTAKPENADDKPFQQPLNDTGSDLMESVAAEDSKKTVDKALTKQQEKEVPSGLIKLRDVLRRLRERIRQLPSKNTTTFNWSQV
ncbi:hypothetical protein M3Y97_00126300 [Aphelenchoides bicaudatus]|nr:hypothetical protein M3Y97_00126300 [Aphelenchoides bicaudatus]